MPLLPPYVVAPYNAPSGPTTSADDGGTPFPYASEKASNVTTAGGVMLDSGGVHSAQALRPKPAPLPPTRCRISSTPAWGVVPIPCPVHLGSYSCFSFFPLIVRCWKLDVGRSMFAF